jgi:DNA (cytosine-5)-methyltransferase 1
MGTGGHNVPLIKDDYGFRKLTPRECFNLQGFPKEYKLPQDVGLSQLYKQAGNSVTVEMIGVLAKMIKEALDTKYAK